MICPQRVFSGEFSKSPVLEGGLLVSKCLTVDFVSKGVREFTSYFLSLFLSHFRSLIDSFFIDESCLTDRI